MDLTGKAYQIEPACTVSGRGCRISRVGNYRSYMPTRHQEDTSGSHGFETPDQTCLLGVSGRSCRISLVGNYRSYMPTRHQEGTSGSHGFETPDRTCLLGVEPQSEHAYGAAGFHGLGPQNELAFGAAIMRLSMFSPRVGAAGIPWGLD